MVVLEAFGLASKELFDYNRENYKFDQEQRLERDMQRVEMQINRFDLFREDIEDLVKLTVDKMDMYHIVGALFLSFTALVYCEGIIEGPQPSFFMGLYLLTVAASFVYLLLAVWLSMYASIASHSFGVRLRTRYVRLPIPNLSQIQSLTTKLSDFEKQGLSKVMRLPFGPTQEQQWQLEAQRKDASASQSSGSPKALSGPKQNALPETRLGVQEDKGFGREDLLMKAAASVPGKHVELFRKLQAKWQCYDAYARVSMALGVNQMIQSVNYFVVGVTMIQTCSPSCGYAATIIFQSCAFGLMFLDIAGLKTWQIMSLQIVGSLPMVLLVIMLTFANVGRESNEPIEALCSAFYAAPACAFLEALWLELFMQAARPTKDEASLPRRFRTVLFLDVFGDAAYDPTEAEHVTVTAGVDGNLDEQAGDVGRREVQQTQAAASILAMESAQSALRCWEAVPEDLLTTFQANQLRNLRSEFLKWRQRYHGCLMKLKSRRGVPYDPNHLDARALRTWNELTELEQQQNEFHGAVIGPLQRRADGSTQHYDLARNVAVWTLAPSTKVLDMNQVFQRVQDVEHEVTALLMAERGDVEAMGVSEQDLEPRPFFKSRKRVGHHRLPWKSVRRMTAVLQVCWLFLGTESLLNSLGLFSGQSTFGRRLEGSGDLRESLPLTNVPAQWPHSTFFHPAALYCQAGDANSSTASIIIESPYMQYQVHFDAFSTAQFSPVSMDSFPGMLLLDCGAGGCSTAELQDGGRVLALKWGADSGLTQHLPIQGQPWMKLAGTKLPCASIKLLLSDQSGGKADLCYLLAGWDGQHIPLVALEVANQSVLTHEVRPRVDAPLGLAQGFASPEGFSCGLIALHMSRNIRGGARLWALLPGRVEAWDLSSLEALGAWKMESSEPTFQPTSLCEVDGRLLLSGFVQQEPHLFRTEIPRLI
ncbi:unnamed protein product [Durusdinium trenchii]|uniref:Uncharacterized protein n=2 Tax=Durusdinium trenchii TaxID=1381693 RepID=A0ABP0LUC6_9DINO